MSSRPPYDDETRALADQALEAAMKDLDQATGGAYPISVPALRAIMHLRITAAIAEGERSRDCLKFAALQAVKGLF